MEKVSKDRFNFENDFNEELMTFQDEVDFDIDQEIEVKPKKLKMKYKFYIAS